SSKRLSPISTSMHWFRPTAKPAALVNCAAQALAKPLALNSSSVTHSIVKPCGSPNVPPQTSSVMRLGVELTQERGGGGGLGGSGGLGRPAFVWGEERRLSPKTASAARPRPRRASRLIAVPFMEDLQPITSPTLAT